jgi:hypothetical protein
MATRYYTFRRQVPKLKPGQRVDFRRGHGYFIIPAPHKIVLPKPPVVEPPHPVVSLFSGDGLFCTTDTDSSHGWIADWTAAQIDPEGDSSIGDVPGRLCYWTARPTLDMYQRSNREGVPLIVQSESEPELLLAIELFRRCPLEPPHALVGKVVKEWLAGKAQTLAVAQNWDLVLEWYWTNEPAYVSPNADGYPLFRNVCYGTFASETVPGRRVYVDEQDAIWKGPRSVWDTESATGRDRLAFNAR